jgi:hypothetical protein
MLHPVMKNYFQLKEQDQILGIFSLGKTEKLVPGKREIPLSGRLFVRSSVINHHVTI